MDVVEPMPVTVVPRAEPRVRLALGLASIKATKNGFGDVVLGISGGIDSALTAAIAADALGAEQPRSRCRRGSRRRGRATTHAR